MSASYYETCKCCKHVFKPKKMNKRLLLSREDCICACHWTSDSGGCGITSDDARKMLRISN